MELWKSIWAEIALRELPVPASGAGAISAAFEVHIQKPIVMRDAVNPVGIVDFVVAVSSWDLLIEMPGNLAAVVAGKVTAGHVTDVPHRRLLLSDLRDGPLLDLPRKHFEMIIERLVNLAVLGGRVFVVLSGLLVANVVDVSLLERKVRAEWLQLVQCNEAIVVELLGSLKVLSIGESVIVVLVARIGDVGAGGRLLIWDLSLADARLADSGIGGKGLVVVPSGGNIWGGGVFPISLGLLCGRLFSIVFGFAFLWGGSVRHWVVALSGGEVGVGGMGLIVVDFITIGGHLVRDDLFGS